MTDAAGYFTQKRPEMMAFLPANPSRLIEIGCAEGGFSGALAGQCEVWGCEANANAAQVARKRLSKVLNGNYEEVSETIPPDFFDVAVCNDVIEHMPDPEAFLHSISTKLRPGGYLVGSVPNVRHIENLHHLLVSKDWKYEESGVRDRTHLRFFTEKSLRRTLSRHGFIVERIQGITTAAGKWKLVALALSWITLGGYSDVRYLQFAFRARKADKPDPEA